MLALGADKERYFTQLLPSLCFNRYDVAEGVSMYSQATWRQVMGDEGRTWVARCLPQVFSLSCAFNSKTCSHAGLFSMTAAVERLWCHAGLVSCQ